MDRASEIYRRRGTSVEINIESGHSPASGITVSDGNWSFVTITSVDSTVTVDGSFTGTLIRGDNCWLPTLDTTIDMQNNGDDGYTAGDNAVGRVANGSGVLNAGDKGLVCRDGFVSAPGTDWSGATNQGVYCTQMGGIRVYGGTADNCGAEGFFVSRGGRMHCHPNASAQNCSSAGFNVRRGFMNAQGGNADGSGSQSAGRAAVHAETFGFLNFESGSASGATDWALFCQDGSRVHAYEADISNAGNRPFYCENNSNLNLRGANVNGGTAANRVLRGAGHVNLLGATFDSYPGDVLELQHGGNIVNATGATVDGSAIAASNIAGISSLNAVEGQGIVFSA